MRVLRSVAAVLAGYVLISAAVELLFHLTGRNPYAPASQGFVILTTVYGFFFAALGGYLAARIAGRLVLMHGAVLACLIGLIAVLSLFAELGSGSIWSQIVALLFMAPAVMIGAMMRLRKT